jgi:hypothetical protein
MLGMNLISIFLKKVQSSISKMSKIILMIPNLILAPNHNGAETYIQLRRRNGVRSLVEVVDLVPKKIHPHQEY